MEPEPYAFRKGDCDREDHHLQVSCDLFWWPTFLPKQFEAFTNGPWPGNFPVNQYDKVRNSLPPIFLAFTFSEAPSFLQQTNQVEANGKNGEYGEVKSNDGRVWLGRLVGLVGFSLNLQQILHGMSSNLGWGHFSKRQNTRIEGGSTHELVKVNPSPSIMTAWVLDRKKHENESQRPTRNEWFVDRLVPWEFEPCNQIARC